MKKINILILCSILCFFYSCNGMLDASKSNAIYGRSYTVQPAAYYVHIWKRVA